MFGMGLTEIITLLIVILILINPKDLPIFIRKAGRIYAKIMKQINEIKKTFSEFEHEVQSVTNIKSSGKSITLKEDNKYLIKGEK